MPCRDVVHNEYHVGIYQQEGEDAKEDSRNQERLKYLGIPAELQHRSA